MTNAVVGFYANHYGRGPTRAKSYIADDLLVCVMQDVFEGLERVLLEHGRRALVLETRLAFHEAMREQLEPLVAKAAGRPVTGSTARVTFAPEALTVTFVLASRPTGRLSATAA